MSLYVGRLADEVLGLETIGVAMDRALAAMPAGERQQIEALAVGLAKYMDCGTTDALHFLMKVGLQVLEVERGE